MELIFLSLLCRITVKGPILGIKQSEVLLQISDIFFVTSAQHKYLARNKKFTSGYKPLFFFLTKED